MAFLQGHFPAGFRSFRETPPDPAAEGEARRRQDSAYRFFQEWSSGRLPKMLVVLTQHATPYYDDSCGVNSANMGPYGDALTQELYPEVERRFRNARSLGRTDGRFSRRLRPGRSHRLSGSGPRPLLKAMAPEGADVTDWMK